jgi:hypothetical protein
LCSDLSAREKDHRLPVILGKRILGRGWHDPFNRRVGYRQYLGDPLLLLLV